MKNILLAIGILTLIGCGSQKEKLVKIKTSYGDMTVVLYDDTPLHKANFIALAESGKYDETIFHRVIDGFMIQGGDIYLGKGEQEPEDTRIAAEIVEGRYHVKGALAAARQPDQVNPEKNSSSCQFYIVDGVSWDMLSTDLNALNQYLGQLLADTVTYGELLNQYRALAMNRDMAGMTELSLQQKAMVESMFEVDLTIDPKTKNNELYQEKGGYPPLDGDYTVFGQVIDGLDVIDKIAAVKTSRTDQPLEKISMTMEVIEMSRDEISKTYGYAFKN